VRKTVKALTLMCLTQGLVGCSSPAVRCDSHLTPINAPAKRSDTVPQAVPSTSDQKGANPKGGGV
jgi:hypothetical protein